MAYSTMTATTLLAAVRDITDLDTDDIPDSLLKLYARDGYYRILDLEKRWPFLETSFTFPTVLNTRSYAISAFTADPIAQVTAILDGTTGGSRALTAIAFDDAESMYLGVLDTAGNPTFYSQWQAKIHLYPKPNSVRTLTCFGYREPVDWVTTGGVVDAPGNLHFPLVYYVCSRVYQRLEDDVMAGEYKRSFDEGVVLAKNSIQKPTFRHPLILNGGSRPQHVTEAGWLQALGRQL